MDDLRSRVAGRLPDDGWTERDLERAISTVVDHGLTGGEAVEAGVRRVCLMAGLDPDSASDAGEEVFGADRARKAEPYVRQVREEVFGSPEPPAGSMGEAVEGFGARIPGPVEDAAGAVADATGFSENNVIRWIYTGERPPLSRAYVRTEGKKQELPDGTWIRRKEARIVFHAPISRAEALRAWRRVSAFFEANGIPERPMEGRTRGPKVTDLDRQLWRLMEEMSDDVTWPDRAEAWADLDPPDGWTPERWRKHRNVTADALRIRWKRLQDKLKRLEPQEED